MEKYTQKQLKELVKAGAAVDITSADHEVYEKIRNEEIEIDRIGCSFGVNGLNGLLVRGCKTNKLYAICARSTAIFIFA